MGTRRKDPAAESQRRLGAYFVYLYRDERGRACYVGHGKDSARATSHLLGTHNEAFGKFLENGRHRVEIAGPYGSGASARAVETALISALQPRFNLDPGPARLRFRPLGVPERFADRTVQPALDRDELFGFTGRRARGPILLVRINDRMLADGRIGYNRANLPTDAQILNRIDRWWQVGRFIPDWVADPHSSPRVLVGITGLPREQIVVGAVSVDTERWATCERDGALARVPTAGPEDLDAFGLRGRWISTEANIRFGPNRNQVFILVTRDGTLVGGNQ